MLLFILIFISCSSIALNENEITGSDFEIKNNEFLNLILEAKEDFKKKYKGNVEVVVVDFIGEKDLKIVNIISKSYLYFSIDEKDIINEKFEGITKINGTIILLKNYNKHEKLNLVKFKNGKNIYKIKFGSFMNFCTHEYSYDKGFILTDKFCSPDW